MSRHLSPQLVGFPHFHSLLEYGTALVHLSRIHHLHSREQRTHHTHCHRPFTLLLPNTQKQLPTLALESILADISPSRMSCVSSSSKLATVVLKATAIRCRSTLLNGLKYYIENKEEREEGVDVTK